MARDTVRFVSLLFTTEAERAPQWQPATDLYVTPDGWLVKLELAGVYPDDVELALIGRTLRVRGRRRDCCAQPGCRLAHMEIAYSRFERVVELPGDLHRARIVTEFRHGMLLVRIQREDNA
jgi:HSP20 family protein